MADAQQPEHEAPLQVRNWLIGISGSLEMADRRVIINDPLYDDQYFTKSDQERPRLAHTSGIFVNYFFNERLGVGSGISYSLKGYQIPRSVIVPNVRPGPPDVAIPAYHTYVYGRHFIDIPITAILRMGSSRFRSISQAGIALNILRGVSTRTHLEYHDGSIYETSSFHRFSNGESYLSAIISTGVSYNLTERLELRAEPVLRYMFWNSRIDRDPYYTHYWNAGIGVGAFITL